MSSIRPNVTFIGSKVFVAGRSEQCRASDPIAVAYGTPPQIVIMFIYTIVFNLVQGNIVTPLVYSRTVSLHPAVVLLSIPAGAALAGIAGMFLIVPVLAVIQTTFQSVVLLLGDKPAAPPAPPAPAESADEAGAGVLVPKPAD